MIKHCKRNYAKQQNSAEQNGANTKVRNLLKTEKILPEIKIIIRRFAEVHDFDKLLHGYLEAIIAKLQHTRKITHMAGHQPHLTHTGTSQ